VIYLHGNSGCQWDACEILRPLLSANITVFAFDFAGCGNSDGDYITLGIHEREDTEAVVQYLRSDPMMGKIGLWGRSMGAATAILYAKDDPSISSLVLDSPYSNLQELAAELVEGQSRNKFIWFPRLVTNGALAFFRSSVKRKLCVDISQLDIAKAAKWVTVPASFALASGDDFVRPYHTKRVHEAYAGKKQLMHMDGNHNGLRPSWFYNTSASFLQDILQPPPLLVVAPHTELDNTSSDADNKDDVTQVRSGSFLHRVGSYTSSMSAWITGNMNRTRSFSMLRSGTNSSKEDDFNGGESNYEGNDAKATM